MMLQPKRYYSANDNAPLRQARVHTRFGPSNSMSNPDTVSVQNQSNPIRTYKIKSAMVWLIPLLAVISATYALYQDTPLSLLFWPSVIMAALLLLTAARAEPNSRLRNISGLLMVAAITTALAAVLSQNGFTLVGVELALLVSALSLMAGWIFKSTPSILLSAFSGLFYLANAYPELGLTTGLTDKPSQLGAGIIPFIVLGQITLAQKYKSAFTLFAGIIAGYIWLGTLAADMPLSALTGLGFAVAAAHYWLGKAWAEAGIFGADIHRICAWVVALSAALYVQSIWMSVDSGQAKPFWPPNTFWWAILGTAIFTLFVASLLRYKTSHITLLGIFIICLAVAALPLAMAKPDLIYAAFDHVPGLNARPGLGLVIGATIIAGGFFWLVGGLKSGHVIDMSIGALTISIQSLVLFQLAQFDTDLGVVFIVSLICALCIGGLIAGASPDRSYSRTNYA